MKNLSLVLSAVSILFLAACKKDDTNNPLAKGFVAGTVYAAIAGKTISGAKIYIDFGGQRYQTQSNTQGAFNLEAPVGHHDLYIETGAGKIFQTIIEVDIFEGQTTNLSAQQSRLECRGEIAYVPGTYDAIQQIIIDSLGYPITPINPGTFMSISALQAYDAIFVNCGATDLYDSASYANLAQYISEGGSVYVSDYAVSYLIGIHSGNCSRPLGFIDDSFLCSVKMGSTGMLPGNIVAPDFQAFMGTNTMNIIYDLPQWEFIQAYDNTYWETVVELNPVQPLMLRKADFSATSGNIYYTTFHNQPNGMMNQDMQHMLEFVILNL